jgi:uncharacterized protein (DUF2384 family)
MIFKREDLAEQYLVRSNAIFGGRSPMHVARTNKGANWVIEELTDAAFGTPALPSKPNGKAPAPFQT